MGIEQALLTALLSGVFSTALTFGLNERRDRRQAMLAKVEDAATAYLDYYHSVATWISTHLEVMRNPEIGHTAAVKLEEMWIKLLADQKRANLLIRAYAPTHSEIIIDLTESYTPFIDHSVNIIYTKRVGERVTSEQYDQVSNASAAVAHAGRVGTEAIIGEIRAVANAPHLVRVHNPLRWAWKLFHRRIRPNGGD